MNMTRQSKKKNESRILTIHNVLLDLYGPQKCFLNHTSPFQLLVATILSAQCTDRTVNQVTPALFQKYPDPAALAAADPKDLEALIHPCGFFHAKGKNLRAMANTLMNRFQGRIPQTMEELISLPGVGRKTANVVLGDAFGIPGLPVDTHVLRLSGRIGIDSSGDPVKVENTLCSALNPRLWSNFSHLLILHGRRCCTARKPDCENCVISCLCDSRNLLGRKKR